MQVGVLFFPAAGASLLAMVVNDDVTV